MYNTCENCGRTFFTENKYAYYCSKNCYDNIVKQSKKKNKTIISEDYDEYLIITQKQIEKEKNELKQKYYNSIDNKYKNLYAIIHSRWDKIRKIIKNE